MDGPANADSVWYSGRGWVAGIVLLAGGGETIVEPAMGVRYRCDDMEDCGLFIWLCA